MMQRLSRTLIAGLLATTLLTAPAKAEPISTAIGLTMLVEGVIGGTAIFGITAGAIGGAIVGLGVSVGLNLLSNKIFGKAAPSAPSAPATPSGAQLSLSIGAATPRSAIIGLQATAGQLAYWNLYGPDNEYLQLVFPIGVGLHDGLNGVYVNGKRCTLGTPVALGTPVEEFRDGNGNAHLWLRFFHGAADQAADAQLVTNANPAGRWTSAHRGAGVCYVSATLHYDPTLYPSGVPQFLFEVRGLRLYDPRKDSSNGGSGAHRWADPTTWEYSDNPAIGLYTYERGLFVSGVKQIGRGLQPVDLVTDYFVAAANVCDETVTNKDASTEKRYRIGMIVGADRDYAGVEQDFCTAMAGWLYKSAGAHGPIAGTTQLVDARGVFSDADLVVGKTVKYSDKLSRTDLVNAIFGTFSDPAQMWQQVPYPARTSSADETADGQRFEAQHDYPMIPFALQVQRVGEIERRLGRLQATATVPLGFNFSMFEPGDWMTWTSASRGFSKTFLVKGNSVDDDQSTLLTLREIDDDVFDFVPADDQLDPLDPGAGAGRNTPLSTIAIGALDAVQISGAGGLVIPALRINWSPVADRTVTAVMIEYRATGQPAEVKRIRFDNPAAGEGIIAEGIQAGTAYEARGTIETRPARATTFTSWVPQTAPPLHVVPTAKSVIPGGVDPAALSAAVAKAFAIVNGKIAAIEDAIATVARQDATQWSQQVETRRLLSVREGVLSASIEEVSTVAVSTQTAFANYQVTVAATFGDLAASVATNATAIAGVDGKLAASFKVNVNAGSHEASLAAYADNSFAAWRFRADGFQISLNGTGGGGAVDVFEVAMINGAPAIALKANVYADGSIIGRNIAADTLTGNLVKAVTIDTVNIKNAAITVFGTAAVNSSFGLSSSSYFTVLTLSLSVTATLSSTIGVDAMCRVYTQTQSASPQDCAWAIFVNGSMVEEIGISQPGSGTGASARDLMFGLGSVTGTGSAQTITIDIKAKSNQPMNILAGTFVRGVAYKK